MPFYGETCLLVQLVLTGEHVDGADPALPAAPCPIKNMLQAVTALQLLAPQAPAWVSLHTCWVFQPWTPSIPTTVLCLPKQLVLLCTYCASLLRTYRNPCLLASKQCSHPASRPCSNVSKSHASPAGPEGICAVRWLCCASRCLAGLGLAQPAGALPEVRLPALLCRCMPEAAQALLAAV